MGNWEFRILLHTLRNPPQSSNRMPLRMSLDHSPARLEITRSSVPLRRRHLLSHQLCLLHMWPHCSTIILPRISEWPSSARVRQNTAAVAHSSFGARIYGLSVPRILSHSRLNQITTQPWLLELQYFKIWDFLLLPRCQNSSCGPWVSFSCWLRESKERKNLQERAEVKEGPVAFGQNQIQPPLALNPSLTHIVNLLTLKLMARVNVTYHPKQH